MLPVPYISVLSGLSITWDLLPDVNTNSRAIVLKSLLGLSSRVPDLLTDIAHVCKGQWQFQTIWWRVPCINSDSPAGWMGPETIPVAQGGTFRLGLATVVLVPGEWEYAVWNWLVISYSSWPHPIARMFWGRGVGRVIHSVPCRQTQCLLQLSFSV